MDINLKCELQILDTTQKQFAQICGVTDRTVRNWVAGRTRMPAQALIELNRLIGE